MHTGWSFGGVGAVPEGNPRGEILLSFTKTDAPSELFFAFYFTLAMMTVWFSFLIRTIFEGEHWSKYENAAPLQLLLSLYRSKFWNSETKEGNSEGQRREIQGREFRRKIRFSSHLYQTHSDHLCATSASAFVAEAKRLWTAEGMSSITSMWQHKKRRWRRRRSESAWPSSWPPRESTKTSSSNEHFVSHFITLPIRMRIYG